MNASRPGEPAAESPSEPGHRPPGAPASPRLLLATLALASASGTAGLLHQLLWTRRLIDVLGADAGTFSKVIGAFFAGLALGAAWSTRLARPRDHAHAWRRVAAAEAAVAALALPMLAAPGIAEWLMAQTGTAPLRWMLPPLLIIPPAIAMGLAVPLMLQALAAAGPLAPRTTVRLYALNTLGGVAGTLAGIFLLLPALGLTGASLAACAINGLLALFAFLAVLTPPALRHPNDARDLRPDLRPAQDAGQTPISSDPTVSHAAPDTAPLGNARGFALAFASGALVLGLEVVLQHQFAQVTINSLFSSAFVLTLVLAALALAAAVLPLMLRLIPDPRRLLTLALGLAALACLAEPILFTQIRPGLGILPYELPPLPYSLALLQLGGATVVPAILAAGLIFPLLLAQSSAAPQAPRQIGRMLFWNGLGGWCGAELAHAWIVPSLGLWLPLAAFAAAYGALTLIVPRAGAVNPGSSPDGSTDRETHPNPAAPWAARLALPIALAACIALAWPSLHRLPQARIRSTERLAQLNVGREGVVATVECGPGDWRLLFNNSYTLGGSKARFNQERQGLLPLLLHPKPASVATLGLATGSTVAGTALHPDVAHIDAIELSPLVIEHARNHFGPFTRHVLDDPRVRVHAHDARWLISAQPGRYDVIVGDLFLPWRTGEGRLFALEHFRNVRQALRPNGLYCQWLPLFQLTQPQVATITRTFLEVFPEGWLVRGDFYADRPIIGLIGGPAPQQIDWARVTSACQRIRDTNASRDPLVRHAEGVAMMVLGPIPAPGAGPINTLANSWLEWNAGRNIIGLREPWFVAVPAAEFLRAAHRAGTNSLQLPPPLARAHDAGQFFLTTEIAAHVNHPQLPELLDQASQRLPDPLRHDTAAEWRQWPMRRKPALSPPPARPSP